MWDKKFIKERAMQGLRFYYQSYQWRTGIYTHKYVKKALPLIDIL